MDEPEKTKRPSATRQLNSKEKEDIHQKIQFDMCNIYHYLVKFGLPSNGTAGIAYVVAMYNATNASSLIYWYSSLIILNLVNLLWAIHFEYPNLTPKDMRKARRGSIYIVAMICLTWGSISILFLPDGREQETMTLIFLSGALICFSITTVIDLTIGIICIICIVGPGVIYNLYLIIFDYFMSGKFDYFNMSFTVAFAIVGVFLMLACYIGNRVFINIVRLGYINVVLSQKLENINASLEQRIKKRTLELENLYSLTQATLESTQEGILAVSTSGVILTYNNKFLKQWGITKNFLLSAKLNDIFTNLAAQVDDPEYFLKTLKHQNKCLKIKEFRLKSGVILEYYTHPQSIHKKVIGTVHSFQDISERNRIRMQASLQDRLATTGRLVANVAHEVNNPISWILSNLQLIKQKFGDLIHQKTPDNNACLSCITDLQEVVTESIEGAVRIQEIIRMFNKFGRVDKEASMPINVHEILNTAISMAMIQVKHNIKLEKNFAPYQPVIIGNNNKLHQVFLNLIINAVQSFPSENHDSKIIAITTVKEGNMFRIDIKDTGAGIPQEFISRIFEPFFTTKSSDEGTGLGLSICKDILKEFEGKITVQSELGKGSIFSVHLPIWNG
jgi:PAS domain S-box-containing protein